MISYFLLTFAYNNVMNTYLLNRLQKMLAVCIHVNKTNANYYYYYSWFIRMKAIIINNTNSISKVIVAYWKTVRAMDAWLHIKNITSEIAITVSETQINQLIMIPIASNHSGSVILEMCFMISCSFLRVLFNQTIIVRFILT